MLSRMMYIIYLHGFFFVYLSSAGGRKVCGDIEYSGNTVMETFTKYNFTSTYSTTTGKMTILYWPLHYYRWDDNTVLTAGALTSRNVWGVNLVFSQQALIYTDWWRTPHEILGARGASEFNIKINISIAQTYMWIWSNTLYIKYYTLT